MRNQADYDDIMDNIDKKLSISKKLTEEIFLLLKKMQI